MRALTLSCLFFLLASAAFAALQFPALSGRIVDDAHMLSPGTTLRLNQMLADYENGTTNQVVIVTLASLQDTTIEDYGYQLGRKWGIGQKGKDNGVLLIVAPKEHKVRIEVGYGLEGTLTDAASSEIIHNIILPQFRAGKMEEGVVAGTQAILSVLGGTPLPTPLPTPQPQINPPEQLPGWAGWVIVLCVAGVFIYLSYKTPAGLVNASTFGNSRLYSRGWGGGGFSSSFGGFSGGGGSFGGGGASGGW